MLLSAAASILRIFRIKVNVSLSLHNLGGKVVLIFSLEKTTSKSFSGYTGLWFWRRKFLSWINLVKHQSAH